MDFFRNIVCAIVMRVLFFALRHLQKKDDRIQKAFAFYPKGYVFRLKAAMTKNAATVSFGIGGDGTLALFQNDARADLTITVKSLKEAFWVFTGMTGIAPAYAQHRFFIKGNPYETMPLVKSLELVEAYLFPAFWAKFLLLKVPEKQCSSVVTYLCVVKGLLSEGLKK